MNTDAVPFSENTTFQISNRSHQSSKKAGLVTLSQNTRILHLFLFFLPVKKGGGQQNEPEVCQSDVTHLPAALLKPVLFSISICSRVQKALPWLMLPHVVVLLLDLAVLVTNHNPGTSSLRHFPAHQGRYSAEVL